MPSDRFNSLVERVRALEKSLLPETLSDVGEYTQEVHDRTLGYRLLVHAEIEHFLEQLARETAVRAPEKWEKDRTISKVIMHLVIYGEFGKLSAKDFDFEHELRNRRVVE